MAKRKGRKNKPKVLKRSHIGSAAVGVPTVNMAKYKEPGRRPSNAFNVGNEVWRQRSKHGRNLILATPAIMAEAAHDYFTWCDEHPMQRAELHRDAEGNVREEIVSVRRPYLLPGLCVYMGITRSTWRVYKEAKGNHADFLPVIDAIEHTIENQQVEGALTGFFNANLTSRINNIAENTNMNHGIQKQDVATLFPFKRPPDSE